MKLSSRAHKASVALHMIVSVGWVGVAVASLILGLNATGSPAQEVASSAFGSMGLLSAALFPPLPLSVLVTGIVLSLTTKWGLFRYYWVLVKIALTAAVSIQGITVLAPGVRGAVPSQSLIVAGVTNLLMLVAATVISVYKPWGKIRKSR